MAIWSTPQTLNGMWVSRRKKRIGKVVYTCWMPVLVLQLTSTIYFPFTVRTNARPVDDLQAV